MNLDVPQVAVYVLAGLILAYAEDARRKRAAIFAKLERLDRRLLRMEIKTGVYHPDNEGDELPA